MANFTRARQLYSFDEEEIPVCKNPFLFPKKLEFLSNPNNATDNIPPGVGPNPFSESCPTKIVMSAAMGYLMGNAMGFVFGSYETIAPPIPIPGQRELPSVPIREQLRSSWRLTGQKCKYWGNNFMIVTAVFSGVECLIEKSRAKHDMVNGTLAGCATGAALAAGQGPQAMCLGCAGFAAFSAAMEHFMGH